MTRSNGKSYRYEDIVDEKLSVESTSSSQKSYVGAQEFRWPTRAAQEKNAPAGCSKRPSSKAAAEEQAADVPSGVR